MCKNLVLNLLWIDGTSIWVAAETTYNERVSRVENQIISRLREHLGAARNATAMFRVFGRFNALFVRPKIRGAIQEWQTQLIDSVKDDIRRLQDKFMSSYRVSSFCISLDLADLPLFIALRSLPLFSAS